MKRCKEEPSGHLYGRQTRTYPPIKSESLTPISSMTTLNTLIEEAKEQLKMFYDDNEAGGSSRWLVSPSTVVASFVIPLIEKVAQATVEAVRVEKLDIVESVMKDPELEQYMKEATGHNSAISEQEKRAEEWLKE